MSDNAKNRLHEILKNLGCSENYAAFQSQAMSPSGSHQSKVVIRFPDGRTVEGTGEGMRKSQAEIAAAKAAIEQLCHQYPDLIVNWDEIFVQAQAGDALIKLAIYLSSEINSASEKSQTLQRLESDANLVEVFDRWKSQNDPDLSMWGDNLGEKRKATLVEALVWRRFGAKIIDANASQQLKVLIQSLAPYGTMHI